MDWNAVLEVLSAFGFGVFIAIFPVLSGEVYLVAGEATQLTGPLLTGLGLGLGQGVGKAILFQLVKQGRRLPWLNRPEKDRPAAEPGSWRFRFQLAVQKATELVEHPRWGGVVIFSSALISFPPNYPTTLLAPFTKIRWATFSWWMLAGSVLRSVLTALIINGAFDLWLR